MINITFNIIVRKHNFVRFKKKTVLNRSYYLRFLKTFQCQNPSWWIWLLHSWRLVLVIYPGIPSQVLFRHWYLILRFLLACLPCKMGSLVCSLPSRCTHKLWNNNNSSLMRAHVLLYIPMTDNFALQMKKKEDNSFCTSNHYLTFKIAN